MANVAKKMNCIIRMNHHKLTDISVKPVPKVKKPKIKKSDIETLFES